MQVPPHKVCQVALQVPQTMSSKRQMPLYSTSQRDTAVRSIYRPISTVVYFRQPLFVLAFPQISVHFGSKLTRPAWLLNLGRFTDPSGPQCCGRPWCLDLRSVARSLMVSVRYYLHRSPEPVHQTFSTCSQSAQVAEYFISAALRVYALHISVLRCSGGSRRVSFLLVVSQC